MQLVTATAIAPPTPLSPEEVVVAPTMAAKALSLRHLTSPISEAVTVPLQCLVMDTGALVTCVSAEDGGTADNTVFRSRALQVAPLGTAYDAAQNRISYYRVRTTAPAVSGMRTVLVNEVLSPSDYGPTTPPRAVVAAGMIKTEPAAVDNTGRNGYPPSALRAGAQARVTVTCRVLSDRSLLCRDPRIADLTVKYGLDERDRELLTSVFGRATLVRLAQAHARAQTDAGEDSVGLEGPVTIIWRIPNL